MLRSMYSGISGLKNFQTKLDVIGNNIANVNTYGFKKGRTIFKDLISQSVAGASASTDTRGGVNPKQIGLGSQIAAIDTIHSAGSTQFTGNTLDLAVSGDGFFQVADGVGAGAQGPNGFTNTLYTRAGNFYMDQQGFLVNGDGKYLVGNAANVSSSTKYKLNTEPANKDYNDFEGYSYLVTKDGERINTLGNLVDNQDANFNQSYRIKNNSLYVGNDSTDPLKVTIDNNEYELKIAQNGTLYITKENKNYYFQDGKFVTNEDTSGVQDELTPVGNELINVGKYQDDVLKAQIEDGVKEVFVNQNPTMKPIRIPTTAQSMSIGQDGTVSFVDKDGDLQWAGQLILAKFPNAGGLEKVGSNYFQQTGNSGEPVTGIATTEGIGEVVSGFLEMSNVDLSEEFTEMIVAQRGFQANTRIITTSDEILQELVNLKR